MENEVFLVYGVPQIVLCDNGTVFAGSVFKRLTNEYDVQKFGSTLAIPLNAILLKGIIKL